MTQRTAVCFQHYVQLQLQANLNWGKFILAHIASRSSTIKGSRTRFTSQCHRMKISSTLIMGIATKRSLSYMGDVQNCVQSLRKMYVMIMFQRVSTDTSL